MILRFKAIWCNVVDLGFLMNCKQQNCDCGFCSVEALKYIFKQIRLVIVIHCNIGTAKPSMTMSRSFKVLKTNWPITWYYRSCNVIAKSGKHFCLLSFLKPEIPCEIPDTGGSRIFFGATSYGGYRLSAKGGGNSISFSVCNVNFFIGGESKIYRQTWWGHGRICQPLDLPLTPFTFLTLLKGHLAHHGEWCHVICKI